MSFDFPSSPANDQQYVAANGYVYTYKTATGAWLMTGTGGSVGPTGPVGPAGPIGPAGGAVTTISDTAPVGPVNGQLWWNSTDSNFYIYNGASSQWVNMPGGTLLPTLNNTYNLGSASLRWATIYTGDLSLKNEMGDWTIVEGADDLFITNNRTGKRYKFALVEADDGD